MHTPGNAMEVNTLMTNMGDPLQDWESRVSIAMDRRRVDTSWYTIGKTRYVQASVFKNIVHAEREGIFVLLNYSASSARGCSSAAACIGRRNESRI